MQVFQEELPEIVRFIELNEQASGHSIDNYDAKFSRYLRQVAQGLDRLDDSINILEVGIGTGWFPIMCKMRGLQCKGIDISPQLVAYARKWGQSLGVDPDVEVGNIETSDIGEAEYDAVIACNVFEHVECWKAGFRRIYRALKSGGVMYMESTNKFSFAQSEYGFPLYGWLPDQVRYKMRMVFDDPQIMKLGIDFNQFRYSRLRREFELIGFSKILDRIEMSRDETISSEFRRFVVRIGRKVPLFKTLALTFCGATCFLCIK